VRHRFSERFFYEILSGLRRHEEPGVFNVAVLIDVCRQADDTAKRLSVDSTDLHLELELTNDACMTVGVSAAATATSAASVSTSPGAPSLSSAAASTDPAAAAAASATACQSAAKNPRRIQLTTITTLR
jgi:hypothetical protein